MVITSPQVSGIINDTDWDCALAIAQDIDEAVHYIDGTRPTFIKRLLEDLTSKVSFDLLEDYAKHPLRLHKLMFPSDVYAGEARSRILPNKVHPMDIAKELEQLGRIVDVIISQEDGDEESLENALEYYFKVFMSIYPCSHSLMVCNMVIAYLGYYILAEYYIVLI